MASPPTITFDDRPLGFEPGATILRLAQAHDLYVPTLCFHPDLPPAEACGLCAVEIDGRGLAQACTTLAEDVPNSPKVQEMPAQVPGGEDANCIVILGT